MRNPLTPRAYDQLFRYVYQLGDDFQILNGAGMSWRQALDARRKNTRQWQRIASYWPVYRQGTDWQLNDPLATQVDLRGWIELEEKSCQEDGRVLTRYTEYLHTSREAIDHVQEYFDNENSGFQPIYGEVYDREKGPDMYFKVAYSKGKRKQPIGVLKEDTSITAAHFWAADIYVCLGSA